MSTDKNSIQSRSGNICYRYIVLKNRIPIHKMFSTDIKLLDRLENVIL